MSRHVYARVNHTGFLKAAGSVIDGNPYYVETDMDPQELPKKWVNLLVLGKTSPAANDHTFAEPLDFTISKGGRNDALFKQASSLRNRNVPLEDAIGVPLGASAMHLQHP
jgi:hypothetical protein